MLFLFLFSFFKKPNPQEVDLTTWPERSKEMLRRETTLDHCHQYNTPCNVCFQINWNLDSVVSCSQHSILLIPVKAEYLPQGISMSCHHLQSLLQPHQKSDPLGSRLTPLGSIGLPITAFLLYLLSPLGFCKSQSPLFLSFSVAILSQPSVQLPLLSQLTGMIQGSVLGLTFQVTSFYFMAFFFFLLPFAYAVSWFPDQGSNPCSLKWDHIVLTAGLPENSLFYGRDTDKYNLLANEFPLLYLPQYFRCLYLFAT